MMVDYVAMGKRIRKERFKYGYTIEQLAEILNLSASYIGLIERGQKGLSIETLCKLSDIFGVSTDYLLYSKEELENDIYLFSSKPAHRKLFNLLNHYSNRDIEFLIEFIKLKDKYDSH